MISLAELFWGRSGYYELGPAPEGWTGRYLRSLGGSVPFATLGLGAALSQLQPYTDLQSRLMVLSLAVLAAMWVFVLYTRRAPQWRQPVWVMLIYFAGLLVLSWLLEARSPFFIAFVIIGFLQAFIVFPSGLAVLAIAATSCVMYMAPAGSGWRDPKTWPLLAFLVLLQTAAVSGGGYIGVHMTKEQERRLKMVAQLQAALKENAGLHAQLVTQAREAGMLDERQRLAGEIHDTLAQGLAGIITQLEAAEVAEGADEWRVHAETARTLARQSLGEARRSVQALRPSALENSRLPEAIAKLTNDWSVASGIAVQIETIGEPVPLNPELEVTLFRVAQEALTNVAKHAHATRVGLTVSYLDDVVLLDVRDDGAGFDLEHARAETGPDGHGFGLSGMQQRVGRIGGRLEIESTRGAGTAISASVPIVGGVGQ